MASAAAGNGASPVSLGTDVFDYDAELRRYHVRLVAAADLEPDAQVLDVGCGTGQTTRAAASAAPDGFALGVDLSATAIAQARRLAAAEGLPNVAFECGDAQVHPLPRERFSAGLSRFGTMFFADPVAAFARLARSLRPGARFTQLVWQHSSLQHVAVQRALTGEPATRPTASGAFSMADPATVDAMLTSAGFADVRLVEIQEPVYYGADAERALLAIQSLGMTAGPLRRLDAAAGERALDRLRDLLDARDSDGVWFDSRAWLVTADRPGVKGAYRSAPNG